MANEEKVKVFISGFVLSNILTNAAKTNSIEVSLSLKHSIFINALIPFNFYLVLFEKTNLK